VESSEGDGKDQSGLGRHRTEGVGQGDEGGEHPYSAVRGDGGEHGDCCSSGHHSTSLHRTTAYLDKSGAPGAYLASGIPTRAVLSRDRAWRSARTGCWVASRAHTQARVIVYRSRALRRAANFFLLHAAVFWQLLEPTPHADAVAAPVEHGVTLGVLRKSDDATIPRLHV